MATTPIDLALESTADEPHAEPRRAAPTLTQSAASAAAGGERSAIPAAMSPDDRYERMSDLLQRWVPALLLPLIAFAVLLGGWVWLQHTAAPDLPTPGETWAEAVYLLSAPFHDNGPNDLGIGWQVLYSLGRVLAGFGLAALVGVPLGLMMGASLRMRQAFGPLVQVFRPVSPLAWLPLGLLVFQAVDPSAIFVIFITSIWPIILNTASGVQAIPKDYTNVARVLRLSRLKAARRILIPATLPHILTGMRLAIGIGWMVIVAAEMLTGGVGIGFFIWDEWNNLNVPAILVSIAVIGLVGIALDSLVAAVQRHFRYTAA